eukprot:GILJ01008931.1.p1 GENE.GILJ01008931.1~~GILJ01008931.1.p1  ORF type:complete len:521 (-),score=36.80 GILJ01008931.1:129-1691(-)
MELRARKNAMPDEPHRNSPGDTRPQQFDTICNSLFCYRVPKIGSSQKPAHTHHSAILTNSIRAVAWTFFALSLCIAVLAFPLLIWTMHRASYTPEYRYGVAVGAPTSEGIKLWVRAANHTSFFVKYRHATEKSAWQSSQVFALSPPHFISTISIVELMPSTTYDYQVLVALSSNTTQYEPIQHLSGTFHTYAASPAAVRFAFGSCMGIVPWSDLSVFSHLRDVHDLDFFLHLGDQIYRDQPGELPFDTAYKQAWSDTHFARFMKDIPVYSMYDDHEIKNDWKTSETDSNGSVLYSDAMEWWHRFVASKNPDSKRIGTYWYHFSVSEVLDVFVLDVRQSNSHTYIHDDENKTLLGKTQKQDLFDWLLTTSAPVKIIASPVIWSADDVSRFGDSWASYVTEREEIYRFIEYHNVTGVVLLSGDVHFAAVFQSRPWLWEFSVSPIRALPFFKISDPPASTIFQHDMAFHYGIFSVTPFQEDVSQVKIQVEIYSYRSLLWLKPTCIFNMTLSTHDLQPIPKSDQ